MHGRDRRAPCHLLSSVSTIDLDLLPSYLTAVSQDNDHDVCTHFKVTLTASPSQNESLVSISI